MENEKLDEVMPEGKWQFDESVTAVFENMLERSIPQYELMRDLCFRIACEFARKGTDIVDLGCSKGDSMRRTIDHFGAYNRHVGVEVSKPMLAAIRERFRNLISLGHVAIYDMDLRKDFPLVRASVITSVLTIQFIPIEYRQQIIQKVYDSLVEGGAFIMVEKVLGNSAPIDDLLVKLYLDMKSENSYTQEQIDRKRWALEGVLVPATAGWNEEFLKAAGFRKIDCFWRCLNFAGWLAIK